MISKKILLTLLVAIFLFNSSGHPQGAGSLQPKNLYKEISILDSIMFTAFNERNTEQFKKMFSANLEFFHDKGGLTGYQHTVDFLKKLAEEKSDLKRVLIKGSLEVYPVPGYGAMQIGRHRFTHTENGKTENAVFKFVHIWQQTQNGWQVSRVVSYGH